jgi:hypothetical protein
MIKGNNPLDSLAMGTEEDNYNDGVSHAPTAMQALPTDGRGITPVSSYAGGTNQVPPFGDMRVTGGISEIGLPKTQFFKFTKKQQKRMYEDMYKDPFDPKANEKLKSARTRDERVSKSVTRPPKVDLKSNYTTRDGPTRNSKINNYDL